MQNEGLKRRVNELEVEVSKKFSNTLHCLVVSMSSLHAHHIWNMHHKLVHN